MMYRLATKTYRKNKHGVENARLIRSHDALVVSLARVPYSDDSSSSIAFVVPARCLKHRKYHETRVVKGDNNITVQLCRRFGSAAIPYVVYTQYDRPSLR